MLRFECLCTLPTLTDKTKICRPTRAVGLPFSFWHWLSHAGISQVFHPYTQAFSLWQLRLIFWHSISDLRECSVGSQGDSSLTLWGRKLWLNRAPVIDYDHLSSVLNSCLFHQAYNCEFILEKGSIARLGCTLQQMPRHFQFIGVQKTRFNFNLFLVLGAAMWKGPEAWAVTCSEYRMIVNWRNMRNIRACITLSKGSFQMPKKAWIRDLWGSREMFSLQTLVLGRLNSVKAAFWCLGMLLCTQFTRLHQQS